MKRITVYLSLLAVLLTLGGLPLFAQRAGGGGHGAGGGMGGGAGAGRGSMGDRGNPNSPGGGKMSGMGRNSSTLSAQKTPGELLTQNTKLASKLQPLLPQGSDLQTAAAGFKNLGQFVAAVHVSHNLGIPFEDLKAKMTGPDSESLGKAIHQLKPDAHAKAEAKRANKQAKDDLHESESGS